jgi:hypothetical protein
LSVELADVAKRNIEAAERELEDAHIKRRSLPLQQRPQLRQRFSNNRRRKRADER